MSSCETLQLCIGQNEHFIFVNLHLYIEFHISHKNILCLTLIKYDVEYIILYYIIQLYQPYINFCNIFKKNYNVCKKHTVRIKVI